MYLLINKDNTINYGNEHPIDNNLEFEGLKLIEFPDKSLYEVVGDVLPHEAIWDEVNQKVIRDPSIISSEEFAERKWRNDEIRNVVNKIDQFERDQKIPNEYRTSKMTQEDYYNLLRYRKELCDYPETTNYELGIRPQL